MEKASSYDKLIAEILYSWELLPEDYMSPTTMMMRNENEKTELQMMVCSWEINIFGH